MLKRITALFITLIMVCSTVPGMTFSPTSDNITESKDLTAMVYDDISNPDTSGIGEYVSEIENENSSDDIVELMLYVKYSVKCSRTVTTKAKTYLYIGETATKRSTHYYASGVKFTSDYYIDLSDGTRRYHFKATNTDSGVTYDYFIPSSDVTLNSINHTLQYRIHSGTTHYKVCYCGSYYGNYYESSCFDCFPTYIYYNANGGSGAPGSQRIYVNSNAISSQIPTRFGYQFLGWSYDDYSSNISFFPGDEIYTFAGYSQTLYAKWAAPTVLTTTGQTTGSVNIGITGTMAYFKFTPSVSATYVFESINTIGDTRGYLYNPIGTVLTYNDDGGDLENFKITYNLSAGTTYYYGVNWGSLLTSGTISVKLRRQYDITYNGNGGSGEPSSQTKLYGDTLILSSTRPVKDLWQFNGWAASSSATDAQYQPGGNFDVDENTTLYAVWGYPTGSCGENATWTFSPEDNSLTISGSGAMDDYSATNSAPWNDYVDYINTISIADGITSIGNFAFSGLNKITEIELPDSVTDIGEYAFSGCSALTTINIPYGVNTIESYTFNNCSALTAPILPETVTSIGEYAFFGCSSIDAMNLTDRVQSIGAYAFSGCSNMESINIPSCVTSIEPYTFNGNTKLNAIVIPDTVTIIKEFAFSECSSISSVIIPKGVTEIQRGAFSNCTALTTVTIPDSVSTIGTSIFAYVSENVTIKCYIDTVAHKYATDNEIAYQLMSWGTLDVPSFTKTDILGGISVELTAPKGNIYYTTNGTEPTVNDKNLYKGPITAKKNMTIKAIAVADGWDNSEVAEFYTDIQKVATPYASSASGRVLPGTKIELYCETEGAEIWCTTDGNIPTESDVYTGEIEITEDTTIYAYAVKNGMLNSGLATFNYELSSAQDTPLVTTLEAADITETSAKLSASVDSNNGVLRMVEFIYYEKNNSSVKYNITADETYNAVITGLTPNTEYWYQARALNELGWTMGYIESFTTDAQGVIKPTSIEIDPSYLSMNPGKKKTLLATVLPMASDNRDVFWSSEDTSVVTVDENGVVTAVGLGNTKIKATTVSNRLVAYCNIDVISSDVRGEFDFSEHNMMTNSSNYDEHGYDYSVSAGGNALIASAYLARWDGAVHEKNDVFPNNAESIKYIEQDADFHVQNIIYLPYRKDNLDNDEIKKSIMKYGAVYSSFKVGMTDDEKSFKYFNSDMTNYYYPDDDATKHGGHAIAIIGWDDNYSRTNFDVIPPGNGAFICKNSWGTDFGEDGYFYISYYDKYLGKYVEGVQDDYNAVFYNAESVDNYNKIYQYDYLGPVLPYTTNGKTLYTANVFPEEGKSLEQAELLKAVSFYTYTQGTPYEIYIITDYKDENSLSKISSPIKTGIAEYAGYYTIDLDTPLELKQGTRFAVVIKFSSPTKDPLYTFIEAPLPSNLPHSSNARANSGESFVGMDKKTWIDLTYDFANANFCIKAFTETDDNSVLLQGIDNLGREYEEQTKGYTLEELREKGIEINQGFIDYCNKNSVELFNSSVMQDAYIPPTVIPNLNSSNNYSEGAALPAKYDLREEDGVTDVRNQLNTNGCWTFATYASLESSLKKASFLTNSLSGDGLNQAPGSASSVNLNTTGTMLALGNTLQLEASVYPFDSTAQLIWKSSNNSVLTVSSRGFARAVGVGHATVTVSTADGEASAECAITVTAPVTVDSITINNTQSQIVKGNKLLIDYSVYPENAGDKSIIWEVDDTSVASVNEYGLLTANGGGTVTVTAYSANKSVCDTYTLSVDDGMDCSIDITENNLGVYDTNIFGSMSVNVTNKTTDTFDGTVVMAIYDSYGKLVKVLPQDKEFATGGNDVEFKNVYISGLTDKKFAIKIFVWNSTQKLKPIAMPKQDVIE